MTRSAVMSSRSTPEPDPQQGAAPPDGRGTDAVFAQWMGLLDTLNTLRTHDPSAALADVQRQRGQWPALPPAQDALLQARCALLAGGALLMLGQVAPADAELDLMDTQLQAPALAGAAPAVRDKAQRCATSGANVRASLCMSRGDYAGAVRAYQQALDLARAGGQQQFEAHVLSNLANTFEESGLPAESIALARQALALAEALGLEELVGDIQHNLGNALAASGHAALGLASSRLALQIYDKLGLPQKQGYALVSVAEKLLEAGQPEAAAAALNDRQSRPGSFVNPQYEAYTAFLHGRIAVRQRDSTAARRAFAQALAVTEGQLGDAVGQSRTRLELARLSLAEGRFDDARAQGQLALDLLQDKQAHRDLMRTHELMCQIAKAMGDTAQALLHHEAFHTGYAHCFNEEAARKTALLAVHHEVDLARAEARRQRVENARLTEALAAISARLQHGERGAPQVPPSPTSPDDLRGLGLTPREAEVLFWVTQGKTNEDVMQILGTSLSAVKKHLGRIYEKLGVENRTAAADAARRRRAGAPPG